jgi:hypothetical protein
MPLEFFNLNFLNCKAVHINMDQSGQSSGYVTLKDRKRSMSGKKRPQRVVALEKQPQREMSCCGCFKTTTTRCGIRETAATRKFALWLFLKNHDALWHVKVCRDAKRLPTSLKYRKVSWSSPFYRHDAT